MSQNQEIGPNQALWEKGDFTKISATMIASGEKVVSTIGIEEAMSVLDLGCGDGTTAVPAAKRKANVLGVDISRNLVEAGNLRAQKAGLANLKFEHGNAIDLKNLKDQSFDRVLSFFGAMFAPDPIAVAKEMVRVAKPGATITMGNWIPNDPTLVAQILRICSAYMPAPAPGSISPMTWGFPENVTERFAQAGIAADKITFERDTFSFDFDGSPKDYVDVWLTYYGPTMNAFEAAKKVGKGEKLMNELVELFENENRSGDPNKTHISATFLRVTVKV